MSLRLTWLACVALMVFVPFARSEDKAPLKADSDLVPGTTVPVELVRLPAGKITLKDKDGKEVQHNIKPIWIAKTEITWDQYYPFHNRLDLPAKQRNPNVEAESRPSQPNGVPHGTLGPEGYPAYRIHHLAANQYCAWLQKKTGKKYRLATEAEWEYACRAGGAPLAPKGEELMQAAWYVSNSGEEPHEVAKKRPNAWGLYDMLGNVAEWVIGTDAMPVIKGGSYQDAAEDVNSMDRRPFDPDWQREDAQDPKGRSWLSNGAHIGFRVVRED
jgi:formylglycine-generating enzyme required for sulfatase activity